MLTEIIKMLKKGEKLSLQEIADVLRTDISFVKAQLGYLEDQKYVKKVIWDTGCICQKSNGCKGCGCSISIPDMWELVK